MIRKFMYVVIVLSFGAFGVLLAQAGSPLQEGTGTQEPPQEPPQDCATCHIDVVSNWESGMHAQAYSDPIFQAAWQAQGSPQLCLDCHTTGYDANTGTYTHEGVACAECHGDTATTHPPDPVVTDVSVNICADCHTTTMTEWEHSAHGTEQLACVTCHQPHPQQLRFEDANTLCLSCHDTDARDDYAHVTHPDQQCINCHWFRATEEDLAEHYTSGDLFPTGHSAIVETQACTACHADLAAEAAVEATEEAAVTTEDLGLVSDQPLLEAQVRMEELEAEVESVKAQGENNSAIRLVQGLIVGLAVGGVIVGGVASFRRRRGDDIQERPE